MIFFSPTKTFFYVFKVSVISFISWIFFTFHCHVQRPKHESCGSVEYSKQSNFPDQWASMLLRPSPRTSLYPTRKYSKIDEEINPNGFTSKLNSRLTSPHRPTTSSKSFLPNDKSRMHLFTAFEERSGVRSSSAISTHPRDLTANLIGLSSSGFNG